MADLPQHSYSYFAPTYSYKAVAVVRMYSYTAPAVDYAWFIKPVIMKDSRSAPVDNSKTKQKLRTYKHTPYEYARSNCHTQLANRVTFEEIFNLII